MQALSEERDKNTADTTFYEITIASVDQPKLLCRLSESLVRFSPCGIFTTADAVLSTDLAED